MLHMLNKSNLREKSVVIYTKHPLNKFRVGRGFCSICFCRFITANTETEDVRVEGWINAFIMGRIRLIAVLTLIHVIQHFGNGATSFLIGCF